MTSPSSGVSNPAMIRRVVVFPQPEGPSRVTNSFLWMSRSIDLRTFSPPKDLEIERSSMSFSLFIPYKNPFLNKFRNGPMTHTGKKRETAPGAGA